MPEKLIDVEKVVAVIRAEQDLIAHSYVSANPFCESPGHCAIGALLFAAGMSDEEMFSLDAPSEWDLTPRAPELLFAKYGLRRYHAEAIINANDASDDDGGETTAEQRRVAVIARVKAIANFQRSNPVADAEESAAFEAKYPMSPTPTTDE